MLIETSFDAQKSNSSDTLRILIVDDDEDTSDSMAILLGYWGFEAIAVGSGSEALQATHALSPDLILLDIAMPGMSGLEVATRLREHVPHGVKVPFLVAVSGYGDARTRQLSQEAGIDSYLVKPVDPAELQRLLRQFQHPMIGSP